MENNFGKAVKQTGVDMLCIAGVGVTLGFCAAVAVRTYKNWSEMLDYGHKKLQKFAERRNKKINECSTEKKKSGED